MDTPLVENVHLSVRGRPSRLEAASSVGIRRCLLYTSLAAAVLAQQGQDLAFVQFKVYIFVCDDLAAEPLGDVLY